MTDSNYWDKFRRSRLSRRRLLSGTALAGSGLAAAAVVGCSSDTNKSSNQGSGGSVLSQLQSEVPFDARKIIGDDNKLKNPAPDSSRGGTLVYIGFDPVVLDRYDPHQTQFGPMYANQSAVFSKLYRYASHEEPTWDNILPDLAEKAPEMIGPSNAPLTYVVHLRKGVKFHDSDKIRSNFP